jgi:hypothetical protein
VMQRKIDRGNRAFKEDLKTGMFIQEEVKK